MSLTFKSCVAAAFTTFFAIMIAISSVIFVGPAAAAAVVTAPTQLDRCGTDQDQYVIPLNGGTTYYRDLEYPEPDEYLEPGAYVMLSSSVTIRVETGFSGGPWTFNYTNDPCPAEAVNTMAVNIKPCSTASGLSEVLVTYTNVADATGWYDSDLYVEAYMAEKSRVEISYTLDASLLDGSSVTYDMGDNNPPEYNNSKGLTPGTYTFTAYHSRGGKVSVVARVESCTANWPFPVQNPDTPLNPEGATSNKPRATINLGHFVARKVYLDARKVTTWSKVRYRVELMKRNKFKTVRRSTLKPGSTRRLRVRAAQGSRLRVKAYNPDTKKWVRIAQKKVKLRSRS